MESHPELTRHVKAVYGDDLEALEQAARAVERLMSDPGWAIVSALVSHEAETVATELQRVLQDHPSLTNRLGILTGIRTFEDSAQALIERHRVVLEQQRVKHEGDAASGDAG